MKGKRKGVRMSTPMPALRMIRKIDSWKEKEDGPKEYSEGDDIGI